MGGSSDTCLLPLSSVLDALCRNVCAVSIQTCKDRDLCFLSAVEKKLLSVYLILCQHSAMAWNFHIHKSWKCGFHLVIHLIKIYTNFGLLGLWSLCNKKNADVYWHEWWPSSKNMPHSFLYHLFNNSVLLPGDQPWSHIKILSVFQNKRQCFVKASPLWNMAFWSAFQSKTANAKKHKVYGSNLWSRKDVLDCFVDLKMSIWEEHYICFADSGGFYLFHCTLMK